MRRRKSRPEGIGLEQALEREAADLLSKLKKMIKNKHKAEQDKASINQRVAEVGRSRTHTHPGTQAPRNQHSHTHTCAHTRIRTSTHHIKRRVAGVGGSSAAFADHLLIALSSRVGHVSLFHYRSTVG